MVDRLVAVDDADYRLPDPVLAAFALDMGNEATAVGGALDDATENLMTSPSKTYTALEQQRRSAVDRDRLSTFLRGRGARVAVGRRGSTYDLLQEISAGVWWRTALTETTVSGSTAHSMKESQFGRFLTSHHFTGAGWTQLPSAALWTPTVRAEAFGGSYCYGDASGETSTFVSPTESTTVGVRAPKASNGGLALVEIDGSKTAANLLLTAQDYVTAGTLASTALVANGGTLNPTDRLLDGYSATAVWDVYTQVASGLSNAAHTVKLSWTGYKVTASSGSRVYLSAVTVANLNPTLANDFVITDQAHSGNSVYEYALNLRVGGAAYAWAGNRHGGDQETAFTVYVDGATRTLTDGELVVANTVRIHRTSELRHASTGSTAIATVQLDYTVTPTEGLDVDYDMTWNATGDLAYGYTAMLPTQADTFTRGRAAGGVNVTLLSNDDSVKGSTKSDTLMLWQPAGKMAVMLTVRNLAEATSDWAYASSDWAWLQDRVGGDYNKGYFQRVQFTNPVKESFAPGDVWRSRSVYRAALISDPAILEKF